MIRGKSDSDKVMDGWMVGRGMRERISDSGDKIYWKMCGIVTWLWIAGIMLHSLDWNWNLDRFGRN